MTVALMAVGSMALSAGEAQANHVSCGDTITADTTLDSDLVNCPNNGVVIGADGITLDLNGHLIDGDGTSFAGCPPNEFCDAGVLNIGHNDVTVRQGSVRQFWYGVVVGGVRHNRVLRVSTSRNVFFGFLVSEATRSVVRASSGNDNLAPDGDGLGLFGSRHVRILHNSFRRNPLGIHVEDSTDNTIRRNRFSRNEGFGILMTADRNRVRRNRCVRNAACIIVAPGNRNVIARNRVRRGVSGIAIEKGRGNLVARNVVRRARRNGIYLGLKNPSIGGANNVVRRNRVRNSGSDAFEVNEQDDHSLLKRNVAIGAGDDGFDVASHSTTLTRNRALRNTDLGIEAVRGVIDGGGNVARHNGDPRQCTHVSCS